MDAIRVLKRLQVLGLILAPVVIGAIILLFVLNDTSTAYLVMIVGTLLLGALNIVETVLENRRRRAPVTDPDGESRRAAIRANVRREIEAIERSTGDSWGSAESSGS